MASDDNKDSFDSPPPPYQPYDYGAMQSPPPPYNEVINDPTDVPTHGTLLDQLRSARQQSKGMFDFTKNCMRILWSVTGLRSLYLTVCVGLPISMLVMGSLYFYQCPVQEFISVYLIVSGSVILLRTLLVFVLERLRKNEQEENVDNTWLDGINYLLTCFWFGWFIAGNVWVYSVTGHWSNKIYSPAYCHPNIYYYAFWVTSSFYILIGLTCIWICLN